METIHLVTGNAHKLEEWRRLFPANYQLESVDIDLDEFETYEIASELTDRLRKFGRKGFTVKQREDLKRDLEDLLDRIGVTDSLPTSTLEDQMKIEHLKKVWEKYTSYQIEELLP